MTTEPVKFSFEYERKLRVCFIGAGQHSYRNVYPTFQYAPVQLVAVCDLDEHKAAAYARQFGADRSYTDYRKMLSAEKPDAVFIVAAFHKDGRVQATEIALDALRMGVHVWMEKPTAATVREIEQLMDASRQSGRYIMTGMKKIFFPSIVKAKEIIASPEFGRASSLYIRYPQKMPDAETRKDLSRTKSLLSHIFHPGSIIQYLMGNIRHITYEWEPFNGGTITSIQFVSGAIGTLHLAAGASGSSPLERVEVIGEGANVVVDNGVKLTYYRKAIRPLYGRSASYLVSDETAPLFWEPEFSLGQLYNKNLFYLGYVQEVLHFCDSILANTPPEKGTLVESLEIVKLYDAYRLHPAGTVIPIN